MPDRNPTPRDRAVATPECRSNPGFFLVGTTVFPDISSV